MKILPIKGKWIPVSDIVAGVILADHRYGSEASVSFGTDTLFSNSMYWGEMLCFKNNIKATCFTNGDANFWNGAEVKLEKTGKIRNSLYFITDKWVNPITSVYETIPDYYSATWTSAGKAVFPGVTIGAPKPTGNDGAGLPIFGARYPNQGQQMFDISGGAYGFNTVSGLNGTSNLSEFKGLLTNSKNNLENYLGRKVNAGAYRNGITSGWHVMKNVVLGMRNSGARNSGPALTSYGFKQIDDTTKLGEFYYSPSQISTNPNLGWVYNHHLNRQSTFQFEDSLAVGGAGADNYATSATNSMAYLSTLINGNGSTIKNLFTSGGWFQEFTHWHNMKNGVGWAGGKGDIRMLYANYLQTLGSLISGNFVFKGGYDEIVGYHSNRDSVERVDLYNSGGTGFRISLRKNESVFTDLIDSPVSVVIDFTGTSFAGQNFKPSINCVGIRKVSANVFVFDLVNDCEVSTDATGVYCNFTKPTAITSISGGNLIVTASQKVNVVVFSENDTVTEVGRSNALSTSHTIPIGGATNLRVGIVNEVGESDLISI